MDRTTSNTDASSVLASARPAPTGTALLVAPRNVLHG
ncbi:hypothetical protein RCH21_000032 [Arthrobacter sp. PL16]|nr:hypothetical protein [Arthrobacter sp. PL16]